MTENILENIRADNDFIGIDNILLWINEMNVKVIGKVIGEIKNIKLALLGENA